MKTSFQLFLVLACFFNAAFAIVNVIQLGGAESGYVAVFNASVAGFAAGLLLSERTRWAS